MPRADASAAVAPVPQADPQHDAPQSRRPQDAPQQPPAQELPEQHEAPQPLPEHEEPPQHDEVLPEHEEPPQHEAPQLLPEQEEPPQHEAPQLLLEQEEPPQQEAPQLLPEQDPPQALPEQHAPPQLPEQHASPQLPPEQPAPQSPYDALALTRGPPKISWSGQPVACIERLPFVDWTKMESRKQKLLARDGSSSGPHMRPRSALVCVDGPSSHLFWAPAEHIVRVKLQRAFEGDIAVKLCHQHFVMLLMGSLSCARPR